MIFDTSFVIDIMKNEEKAIRKLQEAAFSGEPQIITTPTIFELYFGVSLSEKSDAEKHKIIFTISHLVTWNLDQEAAERGGEIHGKLIKQGQQIDPIDCMIAGIALVKGEKILTRNAKHFSRIAGLEIETY